MHRPLCFCLLALFPGFVHGAVTVHEVAWMGSTVSANHEWIELYNSGDAAVSLDGWSLGDGMNLAVSLSGTIRSGEHAVLERTTEDSAPGTAFLLYTGALVNTGATLTLRDAGGAIQDQVAGGEEWVNIGGDNMTKETAQYTTRGWVTAPGTPGRANAETGSAPMSTSTAPRAEKKSSQSIRFNDRSVSVPTLDRERHSELVTTIAAPVYAYVNESVALTVTAAGVGETIAASLKHQWSFGDTYSATGTTVTHRFSYPGTYLVTVESVYAKHRARGRAEITVLPVTVSLGRTEMGDILLHNDAQYEVDLSGYVLAGTKELIIPTGTIVLPRGTITIARGRVEAESQGSVVAVYDAGRRLVASTLALRAAADAPPSTEPRVSTLAPVHGSPGSREPAPLMRIPEATAFEATEATAITPNVSPAREGPASPERPPRWPYLALLTLIGVGLAVVLRTPRALDETTPVS